MKKIIAFLTVFAFVSIYTVTAQDKTNNDQNSNAANAGFKGATFGDPARTGEVTNFKGATFGDPARRGGNTNNAIMFLEDYNLKKFEKQEDIHIKWQLAPEVTITNAQIIDLSSDDLDTIWETKNYAADFIHYESFKNNLQKPLTAGHTYKLSLDLSNGTSATFDFIFEK